MPCWWDKSTELAKSSLTHVSCADVGLYALRTKRCAGVKSDGFLRLARIVAGASGGICLYGETNRTAQESLR